MFEFPETSFWLIQTTLISKVLKQPKKVNCQKYTLLFFPKDLSHKELKKLPRGKGKGFFILCPNQLRNHSPGNAVIHNPTHNNLMKNESLSYLRIRCTFQPRIPELKRNRVAADISIQYSIPHENCAQKNSSAKWQITLIQN